MNEGQRLGFILWLTCIFAVGEWQLEMDLGMVFWFCLTCLVVCTLAHHVPWTPMSLVVVFVLFRCVCVLTFIYASILAPTAMLLACWFVLLAWSRHDAVDIDHHVFLILASKLAPRLVAPPPRATSVVVPLPQEPQEQTYVEPVPASPIEFRVVNVHHVVRKCKVIFKY